jgi:glyoxylase-like metal-dependent hydrolase (beta-lactamase superfamily II)
VTRLEPAGRDLVGIRAANPGPFTLSGTNTWIVGRGPAWLIDPGPALPEHLEEIEEELERRGGLGGLALTHDHADHSEASAAVLSHHPGVPVAGARGEVDVRLSDGSAFGPLLALATPGHAPDHLAYVADRVAFTGDAVLGEGSVFVSPYRGALAAYLEGLTRLRGQRLDLICPGHGPIVEDPAGRLDQYISHRLEREQLLLGALGRGRRTVAELLEDAWSDAPAALRLPATWTLAAHLDKLDQEGRLPEGVERPVLDGRLLDGGSER